MKTPLEELMYYMEQNQYFIGNDLLAKYKELLEKEKDLFCQFAKIYDDDLSRGIMRKVQDAFDETFRNNESAM